MLAAQRSQLRRQQRITELGVGEVRRIATRAPRTIANAVVAYQLASISLALETAPTALAEQGITAPATAAAVPAGLVTGTTAVADMLGQVQTPKALDRLIATLLTDASRTAAVVDTATRPAVTGYVRSLNPPSCGRCAVLAGRVYRYSQGFQRHPHCDCLMTPTSDTIGRHLVTDPTDLFDRGLITDLSRADVEAVNAGADLGQVVNVHRRSAGLTVGSSVMVRAGRLTPQGCLSLGSDRAEQVALLRRYGYIT